MTQKFWALPKSVVIFLIFSLFASFSMNLWVTLKLLRETSENAGDYSYEGNDYPTLLPLHVPPVALTFENSAQFSLTGFESWAEWRAMDAFPKGNGFVRLGSKGRAFGISMFHQMHCLQILRSSILLNDVSEHTQHCLNFLRQAVLCASDTTLDPLNIEANGTLRGTDGIGQTHICRNWETVYDFVHQNQLTSAWD
ncbi:hypothetical protein BDP27DRAFT_1494225 [Rhodocollybia butyracea]|uniref:Oxidase ustYa n=1 Tax=Rhodocollybia butyracea TaxID=206335 RepID=A0A9P5TYY1_9AGAR|nr:hypothetical protein BDP27DRAFT_1494225 [Rhodocollybia butyracea]